MGNDNGLIGRLVAGIGGVAVVVSVFLTWYSLSLADIVHAAASQLPAQATSSVSAALTQTGGLTLTTSGWHAVHEIRLVLLLVGTGALVNSISAAAASLGERRGLLVMGGGLLAAVLVAYRIQSPPGVLDISLGPFQFSSPSGAALALSDLLRVHAGAWVALIGAAAVTLGGWIQFRSQPSMVVLPAPPMPLPSASKAPPT